MPRKKLVTWVHPYRIEVKLTKEGEFYIYDYREFTRPLPEEPYGKDDSQRLVEQGFVRIPECEALKFRFDREKVHAILKTRNPLVILRHLINEMNVLGREPLTEEDTLPNE